MFILTGIIHEVLAMCTAKLIVSSNVLLRAFNLNVFERVSIGVGATRGEASAKKEGCRHCRVPSRLAAPTPEVRDPIERA